MIKIKLTQNYTGFNIEGTYDNLNELYQYESEKIK